MKKRFLLSMLVMVIINSAFSQTKSEKKQLKEEKAKKEYVVLKALLKTNTFVFEADRVYPIGVPSISLAGDSYFLKISEGNVNAYLPYFGRVYSANTFGGNGGIEIDNVIMDYELEFNDHKEIAIIKFNSQGKNERFDLTIEVQKGGNAILTVHSINRRSIHFSGKVVKFESNTSP